MFIKLGDQLFNSDLIAMIRPVENNEDQCVVFMSGQSAVADGFLVEVSVEEVEEELAKTDSGDLLKLADDLQDEIDNGKKLSHKVVSYENPAKGMDQCKDCSHYNDVDDCDLVKRPIAPTGWCKRFKE